ncbi:MAG: dethiobiotin synthase [Spirochaetales bacterium]|nr:dethiobiotin synthase [Spirochaetales bacterium]
MGKKFFITGTDTDIGKSYATGLMLKFLHEKKITAITQKPIQTGDSGFSEDIQTHYDIAGLSLPPDTLWKLQNPYIFSLPASPHLSSRIEGVEIDTERCLEAAEQLAATHQVVLIEGAGGLMVPMNQTTLTCDFIQRHNLPTILVTSPKLGSINHTLMSLFLIKKLKLDLKALIYNKSVDSDPEITKDSLNYFREYLSNNFKDVAVIEIEKNQDSADFGFLIE